ncbi:MAG: alanine--tRNA ligase [Ignavibacteria bacterium]
MTSKEIRNSFIKFFKDRGHTAVQSAPVVPFEDPTLLFTNAGMNQFKDVFLGIGAREYSRAVNTQKCIRAGGKHNDLEEVGMDGYHHTFFEMLGNWSFGDYYKKDAIKWAWQLLTEVWKLPKEKLWASVYKTDDEAFEYWKTETDIDPKHILKFDEIDNFWEMGETGPCGPCSEIHIDLTENGCKSEDINAGLEDVIEIWNLVFIQYNRDQHGDLHALPHKHVDTGMGLERIVRALNGKKSNYDTDLFIPIINSICSITSKKYEGELISVMNAIADHIRALIFAISDGAMPSNEGRGYVLRRILRRALRLARKLEFSEPFMYRLVDAVIEVFGDTFPEIIEKSEYIKNVIMGEEISFNITLDKGIEHFKEVYELIKGNNDKVFPGEVAFKLYDTYGFPLDLTQVIAREHGFEVNINRFNEEMNKQKERARSARKDDVIIADTKLFELDEKLKSVNPVYNPYEIDEKGIKTSLLQAKRIAGSDIEVLVLKDNPFYSESGGQVSDTGKIIFNDGYELDVIDSKNNHFIYVKNYDHKNLLNKNVTAVIDIKRRESIQRNHSATHLVHEALRQVLGPHVKQMGSLVSEEHLRFDFPHYQKVSTEEIKSIENLVNSKISENIQVQTLNDLPIDDANNIPQVKKFFGEKYGSRVRVVIMDKDYSIEFCGGTHVQNTGDIGLFKIVKEESISSGVRRIFARTGEGIVKLLEDRTSDIEKIINELPEKYSSNFIAGIKSFKEGYRKTDFKDTSIMKLLLEQQDNNIKSLYEFREKFLDEKRLQNKKLIKLNIKKHTNILKSKIDKVEKINGSVILAEVLNIETTDEFKEIGEEMRKILKNGIILVASVIDNKISLVCAVSDNLIKDKGFSAGKFISEIAKQLGGGGGGRPQLATAGAKDVSKLNEVLNSFINNIKSKL